MSYKITCPYCFEEMQDDEVMFRSEHVSEDDELGESPKYSKFWDKYGRRTEYNPADAKGIQAYQRKIINPNDKNHKKYIKQQADGSYFIRDRYGMVSQIQLTTDERCSRRVCPHCNNPLPDGYGRNGEVKFISIVGITGSGKTVYLSQLLKRMSEYAAKVGLTSYISTPSSRRFVEDHPVREDATMPGSTPAQQFQQPLFYEIVKTSDTGEKTTKNFVLYDVAGENFDPKKSSADVEKFIPFIKHADGVIVLIDPMQFRAISGAAKDDGKNHNELDETSTVLNALHNILSDRTNVPVAVCMSKIDTDAVQNVLSSELRYLLLEDVHRVVKNVNGKKIPLPVFNAKDYLPIANGLEQFINDNDPALDQAIRALPKSACFAFTALGCGVEVRDGGAYPVGPVLPKRIEEPLLWLFYQLGYIGKNAYLPGEIECPGCGSKNNYDIPDTEKTVEEKVLFFFSQKKIVHVNRHCSDCGHEWWEEPPFVG